MEWIAAIISVIGAFATALFVTNREKQKLREEMKLDYSIEAAIHALLSNPNYRKRSLKKIKHHLRGFDDDNALRQSLMRAGAVAFSGHGDAEMWGLISRNSADFK
ncbi:MAG: hypothetical protein AAF727_02950 [Pseudomonadota bacterium]